MSCGAGDPAGPEAAETVTEVRFGPHGARLVERAATAQDRAASVLMRAAGKLRANAGARCAPLLYPPHARALADLLEAFDGCACDEGGGHWPEKSAALGLAALLLGEPEGTGQ